MVHHVQLGSKFRRWKNWGGIKEIQLAENKWQDLGGSLLNDYSPVPTSVWRG